MASEQSISFMVVTFKDGKWAGLGRHEFKGTPRAKEFISLPGSDDSALIYQVITVIHATSNDAANAGDLIVEYDSRNETEFYEGMKGAFDASESN